MKILFLGAFIPVPVTDGDKVRARWTLSTLARRHRVHGFFLDPEGRAGLPSVIRRWCVAAEVVPTTRWHRAVGALAAVARGRTAHAHAFWNRAAQSRLDAFIARWRPDAIHVHRIRMMPYAERTGLPYLLDATDCLSWYFRHARGLPGWRRLYAAADLTTLVRHERRWANGAAAVTVITETERTKILSMGVHRPVVVSPNGLDATAFAPGKSRRSGLLFVGNLGYPPNAAGLDWYFRAIAPRLGTGTRRVPLTIAGGGASPALTRVAAASGLPVRFTGFVASLGPLYRGAAAVLCPLPLAAGLQNKAIEAMAAGTPVVATPNVAAAMGARPGRDLAVAADAMGFARAVDRLVAHPSRGRRLGAAGRTLVRTRFGAPAARRALERAVRLLEAAAR